MMISHALQRVLAASALACAMTANAAPIYLIDATTNGQPPNASLTNVGFSLTYEDFNFDALFSLNELLAFTGVYDGVNNYFDTLVSVPTMAGISGNAANFRFKDSNGVLADFTTVAGTYTAFTTLLDAGSVVPEPGALALCVAGFAALLATRRSAAVRKAAVRPVTA